MKTVLCDLDGVLADSLPNWLDTYNLFTGEGVKPENITNYNFGSLVKEPKTLFRCLEKGLVFLNAGLMDGAKDGLQKLVWRHEVFLVSYNHEDCPSGFAQKMAWVRKHFPWFDPGHIIFTKYKDLVRGDVLIEDNPGNVEMWLDANPEGKAFLVDQPYNRDYSHERCTRVRSVEEVMI